MTPALMYRYSVTPMAPTLVMMMIRYANTPVKYRSTPIHTKDSRTGARKPMTRHTTQPCEKSSM